MKSMDISFVLVLTFFLMVSSGRGYSVSRKQRRIKFNPAEPSEDCYSVECVSPSRYPEAYIRRLLRKKKVAALLGNAFAPTKPIVITMRSPYEEDDDGGQNICDSKEITTFPKTLKDENYKFRFIVNTKEHEQGITYETCVKKEVFINKLLLNYYFFCKQHYSTVRLLYLTENGKLDYGRFPVPSACVCSYKITKN